ncbi:IclR family transcriptional regulator [Actinocrispum wychmicini]|uniref:IclR family transcriptional regulator n=1 Tax=Actinocrispum wychmicini TaxID=1213861 RepID=A0A4R2JCU4_9PSEU|nr:IclR family transcriptional regulator [Actinocrispum wychmicini]TCO55862.1 IclR family transcriptional regulator [Actinocrispum wychmicini]
MTATAPIRMSDRLIAVVESFLAAPSQTLSDVAAACGMEPSTATRYLRQLVEHGWLQRDESSRMYSLGVRLIALGQAAQRAQPLRERAMPHMRALLERFGETVNLAVDQGGETVIIEALESSQSIRRGASVGERDDWWVSSLGKSILAHRPDSVIEQLLRDRPPIRRTSRTRIDPRDVLDDLAEVRGRGYALDDEESEIGLKCVGVPIRDDTGVYRYAISVSGPTSRVDARLDEIVTTLRDVADAINRHERGR